MGVNRAAIIHEVPRTTLKDRLSGRVIHGTKMGHKSYLTRGEEKELVKFLVNCSKMSYGKTRCEVLRIVQAVVKKKGNFLMVNISLRVGGVIFGVMARNKFTQRRFFFYGQRKND